MPHRAAYHPHANNRIVTMPLATSDSIKPHLLSAKTAGTLVTAPHGLVARDTQNSATTVAESRNLHLTGLLMKFSYSHRLVHGKVIQALSRRVRITAPILLNDPERAHILEVLLKQRDGIEKVRTTPETAAVVIYFDPQQLPYPQLLTLLDALLANLGKKKSTALPKKTKHILTGHSEAAVNTQTFKLAIHGMKCTSCALLVELVLQRDPGITAAKVDYDTGTAVITATLDPDDLYALIAGLGFQAELAA